MKWTYQITAADYLAARKLASRKSRTITILLWVAVVMMLAVGAVRVREDLRTTGHVPREYWILVGAALFCLLQLKVFMPQMIRRAFAQQPSLSGPIEMELDQGTLSIQSPRGSQSFPLTDIRGWKTSKQHLIIFPPKGDRHIVPLRVFERDSDKDRFVKALRDAVAKPKATGRTRG